LKIETTLAEGIRPFLQNQLENWEFAKNGYNSLKFVQTKVFQFKKFEVKVQFNPGRIKSSSANVDPKSISQRPCFLCATNLPSEQIRIKVLEKYLLLVNPYPIFPEHFTIPATNHVAQLIKSRVGDLLEMSKQLGANYTLFYNGPKCGASAPDHFHFQAGTKGFMPIENEYSDIIKSRSTIVVKNKLFSIFSVSDYLRNFISVESSSVEELRRVLNKIIAQFELNNKNQEPLLNILANYTAGKWIIILFPRAKHRPSHYYREDKNRIVLSPASVDLGGVCITPREEDYNKITKEIIVEIFNEVTLEKEKYELLVNRIKRSF